MMMTVIKIVTEYFKVLAFEQGQEVKVYFTVAVTL